MSYLGCAWSYCYSRAFLYYSTASWLGRANYIYIRKDQAMRSNCVIAWILNMSLFSSCTTCISKLLIKAGTVAGTLNLIRLSALYLTVEVSPMTLQI
jgi:hypothetical protein